MKKNASNDTSVHLSIETFVFFIHFFIQSLHGDFCSVRALLHPRFLGGFCQTLLYGTLSRFGLFACLGAFWQKHNTSYVYGASFMANLSAARYYLSIKQTIAAAE
jgi:hypothetical protein